MDGLKGELAEGKKRNQDFETLDKLTQEERAHALRQQEIQEEKARLVMARKALNVQSSEALLGQNIRSGERQSAELQACRARLEKARAAAGKAE